MFSVPPDNDPSTRRIAGSQRVSSATAMHEQASPTPNFSDDPDQSTYDASLFSPEWFSNIPYAQQSLNASDMINGESIIDVMENPLDPLSYFNAQLISKLCDPSVNTPQNDLSTLDPLLEQTQTSPYVNSGLSLNNDGWAAPPSGTEYVHFRYELSQN